MIDAGRHIDIMGIVNLTEDSDFEASRCGAEPKLLVRNSMRMIERMMEEGADIIDLGACSTRPGAEPVGADEEWYRIEPVLKAAVVLYMLPLVLFFLGYALGAVLWQMGALVGCLAFVLSIALCVLYDRKIAKKRKTIYTITEFAREEQGGF